MIVRMAKLEGVLLSPSSAANVVSAVKLANELEEGVIVTVFPDHGSNYQEVLNELIR
jgi:cysteine synthase B